MQASGVVRPETLILYFQAHDEAKNQELHNLP